MSNALDLFRYIFAKFVNMIFNDFVIENGVTLGWIVISIIVMGILVGSILNIPNNIRFNKNTKKENKNG